MWNELGISENCNCYFDCAVFRYQMGMKNGIKESLQCYHWKENC